LSGVSVDVTIVAESNA